MPLPEDWRVVFTSVECFKLFSIAFSVANTVAAAMYIVGFVETLRELVNV